MTVTLTEDEALAFLKLKRMLLHAGTPSSEFFYWVAERLVQVHKDDPNVDFVQKLKEYGRDIYEISKLMGIKRES